MALAAQLPGTKPPEQKMELQDKVQEKTSTGDGPPS
jgi:hypothetical protein